MWPFTRKQQLIPVPAEPVEQQVKSLSLPQALPQWRLSAGRQKDWQVETAIREGYVASSIAYACIEKRAKLIASMPWVVQVKRGGEWQEVDNHPLQRLLDRPNPDQSLYELMYHVSQSLDLAGNAFLSEIKAGVNGRPVQLWHLPPQHLKIKPGRERLVEHFEYADHAITHKRIDAADMIHLKMPNPDDPIFGMPTLRAGGRATDIDRESGIWQKVSLENRGASDVNIMLPPESTQEQVDNVKRQYKDQQAGAKNARKAMVTTADIQQLGQTAVEMDFVESRRQVWVEIAAVFGMSLANLGMTESVNLANAEAMDKALWQNTIIPQLELLQRQFNHQLASEFGADVRMVYDTSNVEALQENLNDKLENAAKLFAMGVPLNVINQHLELGMDDVEGGDIGYLAAGLMPVGWDPEPMSEVLPETTEEEKRLLKSLGYGNG